MRANEKKIFAEGEFKVVSVTDSFISFTRTAEDSCVCVLANASNEPLEYGMFGEWKNLLDGKVYKGTVPPYSALVLKRM